MWWSSSSAMICSSRMALVVWCRSRHSAMPGRSRSATSTSMARSPCMYVPLPYPVSGAYNVLSSVPRDLKGHAAMSLVLAADYRMPDFDHWWAVLSRDLPRLPSLGAHHFVVYRSLEDASRIFVTIGFRERRLVQAIEVPQD